MNNKKYGLTQTEYELMDYFWSRNEKLTFRDILDYFNTVKNKNWKKQTLSTFLKILQDQNLIASDTSKSKYLYYPMNTREEYMFHYTHQLVENSFENSLNKFLSAFSGGKKLKSKDIEDLKKYLEQYTEK